jgi:hypothetical protein
MSFAVRRRQECEVVVDFPRQTRDTAVSSFFARPAAGAPVLTSQQAGSVCAEACSGPVGLVLSKSKVSVLLKGE